MPEQASDSGSISPDDIVFECPVCSKSLAIDRRGAGLLITCPGCKSDIQIPTVDEVPERSPGEMDSPSNDQIKMLLESLSKSQHRVQEVSESLSETSRRRKFLEKMRADHLNRFEKIVEELSLIQNSIDRIVTLIENASTGLPPEADG